ncbi:MAG: hypothetical protein HC796_02720 [Synechococcaceae cyanobacterium RL_1_2]|nr:hypothetical protein [Synechococcaceae cyanobacterium RL_1_2]
MAKRSSNSAEVSHEFPDCNAQSIARHRFDFFGYVPISWLKLAPVYQLTQSMIQNFWIKQCLPYLLENLWAIEDCYLNQIDLENYYEGE